MLGVVAHGGMGYVLMARDAALRRVIALKFPFGPLGAEARARFVREAQAAAGLRHPNICQIHRVAAAADGTPFIAMEYLAGRTLRDRLRDGLPAPRDAAAAVVARAVHYAHAAGVVHRDIKPQNVIVLDATGEPILTDFGLAKSDGEDAAELTRTGQVMGTPAYMAPEQAAGRTALVGPRSDVYALGAVLYQLLTGDPPFTGPAGEVLKKVQTEDPVPPRRRVPTVHPDVETVCLKCLAKDPADRYPSAAELADDLARFAGGEPVRARPPGRLRRAGRWARRNRAAVAAGVVVALVGAAAAVAVTRAADGAAAADLRARIDDGLKPDVVWTADHARELDALADALAARDPDRGRAARQDVTRALDESARARLPRFDAADRAYVADVVALLKGRDPAAADRLEADARARSRAWVPVFTLAPPATPPPGVFATDAVRMVDGGLDLGPAGGPARLTGVPCDGNVQVEARFAPGWEKAGRAGVVVNALAGKADGGYSAVVRPGAEGGWVVQLARGTRVLREAGVPAAAVGQPLTVLLQREGDRLLAQVNRATPVTFRDLFPLPGGGVYGLVGPAGAVVEAAEGRRQAAAAAATTLEDGADRFLAGDYPAALAVYQKAAVARAGTPDGAEARFRAAVCLLELGRADEAADRFRELREAGAPGWAALAGCYEVVAEARRKDLPAAHRALDRLVLDLTAGGGDDLTARLPDDVRGEILRAYRQGSQNVALIRDDPERVDKARRLLRAEEALGTPPVYLGWTRLALVRALRADTDPAARPEAARLVLEWLARDYPPGDDATPFGPLFAAEYGWLMREAGTPVHALGVVEARLPPPGGGHPLMVERARLAVALDEPDRAERELEGYFSTAPAPRSARTAADAALMLGLLREKRGDAAGARAAWAAGVPAVSPADPRFEYEVGGGIGVLTAVSLRLLTGTLDDGEFEQLARNLARRVPGADFLFLVLRPADLAAGLARVRAAVATPGGRERLWEFAFQTLPFPEYARRPIVFFAGEVVRDGAFGPGATAEQAAVAAGAVADLYRALAEGRVGLRQAAGLGLAALDAPLAPTTLDPALPADIRTAAGYLLGHRYRRLGKPTTADGFFRAAAAAAPPSSPARARAEAELAPRPAPKP